ncbi:MAG: DISARM system phospholipase D-like protein DrmC [Solirubrobacteraceae bacterium]
MSALDLPSHQRQRLIRALETGMLEAPYTEIAVRAAVGDGIDAALVCEELTRLWTKGIGGAAVAYALELAAEASAGVHRPDLVWSGEEVQGLHARKTRQVFDELVGGASKSLWISSYTYWNGPKAFEKLAARMDVVSGLQVTLLLNIKRDWGDSTPADELVAAFAGKLWTGWPGQRRPEVFYDPRAVKDTGDTAVLHAKAVVADDEVAFVTSANLTEKAFDTNIEAGMLSRDRTVALSLAKHFRILIERELLEPLPE